LPSYSKLDLFLVSQEFKFYGLREAYETVIEYLGLFTLTYGQNVLNSVSTGGTLRIVQYTYSNGASAYNEGTPNGGEGDSWQNNGMFINQTPYKDSEDLSYRSNRNTGSTWCNNGYAGTSTGIIVADITSSTSSKVEISKFCAWQMISDGCTTDMRISYHTKTDDTYPRYDDGSWIVIVDWEKIRAGQWVAPTELDQPVSSETVMRCTEQWYVPSFSTRYLKVEVKNDGNCGSPSYIETRQLRAFS